MPADHPTERRLAQLEQEVASLTEAMTSLQEERKRDQEEQNRNRTLLVEEVKREVLKTVLPPQQNPAGAGSAFTLPFTAGTTNNVGMNKMPAKTSSTTAAFLNSTVPLNPTTRTYVPPGRAAAEAANNQNAKKYVFGAGGAAAAGANWAGVANMGGNAGVPVTPATRAEDKPAGAPSVEPGEKAAVETEKPEVALQTNAEEAKEGTTCEQVNDEASIYEETVVPSKATTPAALATATQHPGTATAPTAGFPPFQPTTTQTVGAGPPNFKFTTQKHGRPMNVGHSMVTPPSVVPPIVGLSSAGNSLPGTSSSAANANAIRQFLSSKNFDQRSTLPKQSMNFSQHSQHPLNPAATQHQLASFRSRTPGSGVGYNHSAASFLRSLSPVVGGMDINARSTTGAAAAPPAVVMKKLMEAPKMISAVSPTSLPANNCLTLTSSSSRNGSCSWAPAGGLSNIELKPRVVSLSTGTTLDINDGREFVPDGFSASITPVHGVLGQDLRTDQDSITPALVADGGNHSSIGSGPVPVKSVNVDSPLVVRNPLVSAAGSSPQNRLYRGSQQERSASVCSVGSLPRTSTQNSVSYIPQLKNDANGRASTTSSQQQLLVNGEQPQPYQQISCVIKNGVDSLNATLNELQLSAMKSRITVQKSGSPLSEANSASKLTACEQNTVVGSSKTHSLEASLNEQNSSAGNSAVPSPLEGAVVGRTADDGDIHIAATAGESHPKGFNAADYYYPKEEGGNQTAEEQPDRQYDADSEPGSETAERQSVATLPPYGGTDRGSLNSNTRGSLNSNRETLLRDEFSC